MSTAFHRPINPKPSNGDMKALDIKKVIFPGELALDVRLYSCEPHLEQVPGVGMLKAADGSRSVIGAVLVVIEVVALLVNLMDVTWVIGLREDFINNSRPGLCHDRRSPIRALWQSHRFDHLTV